MDRCPICKGTLVPVTTSFTDEICTDCGEVVTPISLDEVNSGLEVENYITYEEWEAMGGTPQAIAAMREGRVLPQDILYDPNQTDDGSDAAKEYAEFWMSE